MRCKHQSRDRALRDDSRLGVLQCCLASKYLQFPCEVHGDAGRYRYVAAAMHYTEGRQQRPGRAQQKLAVGLLQSFGSRCHAFRTTSRWYSGNLRKIDPEEQALSCVLSGRQEVQTKALRAHMIAEQTWRWGASLPRPVWVQNGPAAPSATRH